MKESITIKNVGPLKNIQIDDIKPLTVFIGKSASGKSTIMKIVVLMRYIYKMVNIRSYLRNAKITRSPFKLRFDSLLHDGLEQNDNSRYGNLLYGRNERQCIYYILCQEKLASQH